MTYEVALFWAVVAGFLVFDNLLLVPQGGDYLSFGRSGRFRYTAGTRLEARGREVAFLNPLNLFHRVAVTGTGLGPLSLKKYRDCRKAISRALPRLNSFAWIGYGYLMAVIALAAASFSYSFELILFSLVGLHLFFWMVVTGLLIAWRNDLSLTASQAAGFSAESFFVPAYCINLSKRLWYRRIYEIPALTLGLLHFRRIQDETERELMTYQFENRLVILSQALSDDVSTQKQIEEARKCLTT